MSALREPPTKPLPFAHLPSEPAEKSPPGPPVARRLGAAAAAFVAVAVLSLATPGLWAAQAAGLVLLLTVPGVLALRAARLPGQRVAAFPVYVPATSVAVLMAVGLAVNLLAPVLGVDDPLRREPLLVGLGLAWALLALAGASAPTGCGLPWRRAAVPVRVLWPLALAALGAAGAVRLTNGHGNTVAVIATVAAVGALAVSVVCAHRMSRAHLSTVLFGASLALLWSFSLRGTFVYGFDISSEFHTVSETIADGIWHTGHSGDAYGAMLSLTVLPALLHAVTGLSTLALLKIVYPVLLALFPLAVFGLAGRFMQPRWAFAVAAFLIAQSYYFQQMLAIARQEIALLMLVALVALVLEGRLARRTQWPLVGLLGLSVVVSHYSTTYLALAMFVLALVLAAVVWALRRPVSARLAAAMAVATVTLIAGVGGWYVALTDSASNASGFTSELRERGLDLLPNAEEGQGLLQSYLAGNQQKKVPAREYQRLVERQYQSERPYVKRPVAGESERYRLQDAQLDQAPVRHPVAGEAVKSGALIANQTANLLAVLGALFLAFSKRSPPALRGIALLGAATLLALGLLRLSGTAANAYNQERAFLQTMIPLGVGIGCALQWLASAGKRLSWRRWALPAAVALGITVIAVSATGLRGVAFGGYSSTNLADSGEDYERFYSTPPELAGAQWLGRVPRRHLIYADRYGALRVLAATGRYRGLLQAVTPRTVDRHAWVYQSAVNTQGRARGEVRGRYSVYGWPQSYLNEHYDAVYTNGTSRVYHR